MKVNSRCAFGRKRIEPETCVVGFVGPAVLVLGPVVDEKQHPRSRQTLHQRVEKGLGFSINPVEVLEYKTKRLDLGFSKHQPLHAVQRALSPLGWVEILPALIFNRHFEK